MYYCVVAYQLKITLTPIITVINIVMIIIIIIVLKKHKKHTFIDHFPKGAFQCQLQRKG